MGGNPKQAPAGHLVTSGKAGLILGVQAITVRRYADRGLLLVRRRTVGGHRRYAEAEVRALAASLLGQAEPAVTT